MGMGWNLLGGALMGIGQGMTQNADAEQKRIAAEALAMKEQAMARLTNQLAVERDDATYKRQEGDREFDKGIKLRTADDMERKTTATIDNMNQLRELERQRTEEAGRHNKATETIAADKTEANITIANMRAESGRMAAELRALEKQAQLPKEQIEYLKGFSSSRTKILSDTLMPEAEKKSALAALDADLFSNYPPKILRDRETGAIQTIDVLGRTRNFASEKELAASGFGSVGGKPAPAAESAPPAQPASKPSAVPQPSQSVMARARNGDPQAQSLVQAWERDQEEKRRMAGTRQMREADYTDNEMSRAARPAFNLFPSP